MRLQLPHRRRELSFSPNTLSLSSSAGLDICVTLLFMSLRKIMKAAILPICFETLTSGANGNCQINMGIVIVKDDN
jgi:hypothetical protein